MKKKSKAASAVLALGGAVSAIGALVMYRNFFRRVHSAPETFSDYPEYPELQRRLAQERTDEVWDLTAFDGLKLKAHFFAGSPDSHVYAILVHGYHSTWCSMLPQAVHFMEQGFHLLIPEQRGHGKSEGDYIGFGFHEHYDMQAYISMICDRDPDAEIFLLGVSMGAATVMMTAGEFLPSNVRCIIEDCGYTNAWEQCKYNVRSHYHLPAFPLLTLSNLLMRGKHHYSFKEADPLSAVKKAVVPMLFIHGDQDTFVPFSMLQPLYDACASEHKEMLVVPGAGHADSVTLHPELYWQTVDAFLRKYL